MKKTSLWMMVGLCLIIGLALTACGGAKVSEDMTPTQTTEAFLEAFKAQDEDTLDQVYAGKGNDFLSAYEASEEEEGVAKALQDALMEKWYDFDYAVTGEEIAEDGQTATVDLTITTYDMTAVFNNFYQAFMDKALEQYTGNSTNVSEADYESMATEILQEEIGKATEKDYTGEAKLPLTKTSGRWVVDKIGADNEEFLNAITGGLMDVLQDIVDARSDTSDDEDADVDDADDDDGADDED